MQPYFFPYIGYFQLMKAVDYFVFYDDVQYIKNWWFNRNRILVSGQAAWWGLPVIKAPHELPINQRSYQLTNDRTDALKQQIEGAYRKAREFRSVFDQLNVLLAYRDQNIAGFNQHHLIKIARSIRLSCRFEISSEMEKDNNLKGQGRIIDICRRLGATQYLNPIGGLGLYDGKVFGKAGIELRFIKARATDYPQFGQAHVPFLSIIDVLMFNSLDQVASLLDNYEIVAPLQSARP